MRFKPRVSDRHAGRPIFDSPWRYVRRESLLGSVATRYLPFLLLAVLLAGCPARPPQPGAPPAQQPVAPAPRGEGRLYAVAPSESLLTIHVYRAGTLARAGHNHVIASHDITGKLYVNDDIRRSSFQLQFPVTSLTVDEPDLRRQAGPDFPPDVPDSAKEGTRRNMLGVALLNSEQYPAITLTSTHIESSPNDGALNAQVQVTIRDQTRTLSVPIHYELKAGSLVASGELPLKQSDLGLKPFSVMMGALEVRDEMTIHFRIVAHPTAN